MKIKSRKIKIIGRIFSIIIALTISFIYQNNHIGISNYEYTNSKIPKGFDGYRIVQVSDLHNKDFKGRLPKKIKDSNPNIIVITGDLIDRRNTKIDVVVKFIEEIANVAPIYYVTGNHEQLSVEYDNLKKELIRLNVEIIDNSYVVLNKSGDNIGLMGIADPAIQQGESDYLWDDSSEYVRSSIKELIKDIDTHFNILLSHRPEKFSVYKETSMDLVFSGHAHGGQVRIPFIGGVVAPNQGFFPKYTEGIHNEGVTSMVVSRGLGNSIIPLRVLNTPELVVVNLKRI